MRSVWGRSRVGQDAEGHKAAAWPRALIGILSKGMSVSTLSMFRIGWFE